MKQTLLVFTILLLFPFLVQAQFVLHNFDTVPDSTFWDVYGNDDDNNTYLNFSTETSEVHEGDGALRIDWQNQAYDQYGGWIGMTHSHPDSDGVYDFSIYTDCVIWYNVLEKQSVAGTVHFRVVLRDAGPGTEGDNTEQWFSHHYVLDNDPGWHKLTVKMTPGEESDAISDDDGNTKGIWLPGGSWGLYEANGELDLDMIRGWTLEFSQDGSLFGQEMDSVKGVVLIDEFQLEGVAPVNLVFFNGKATPANVNLHVGWSGTVEITDEESADEGTNSIKWSGAAAEWDAVNFTHASPRNMLMNWNTDTLQFKIKAEAEIGDLNVYFWDVDHDPAGKEDYAFQATYQLTEASVGFDGGWKQVRIALTDFNRFAGVWDNDLGQNVPGEFDSTEVAGFAIGNFGQVIESAVYFDDVWTGNPEFDFIPPAQVTGVLGVTSDFYNLVVWEDVAGESGEAYDVFTSTEPITDVEAANVEVVARGVLEGTQQAVHWIFSNLTSKDVTYYYAVRCTDAAGNTGEAGMSSAVTNAARSMPTISLNPPVNFAADGYFDEWDASGIMPFVLKPETDHVSGESAEVTDSLDLKGTIWMAIDNQFLYLAADVVDDSYSWATGNWWDSDALQLFIGFYDERGARHTSIKRGTEPDYIMFFNEVGYHMDNPNNRLIYDPDHENYYFEELGGADYLFEAKIPLDSIYAEGDVPFGEGGVPVNGMRVPFDLYFHDRDNDVWEGNLGLSPLSTDNQWAKVEGEWIYTWIGDQEVMAVDNFDGIIATDYQLKQNYPNPFNPETTIEFAIAKAGNVEIQVYNLLGQNVFTLVNKKMNAGSHQVKFDGAALSSGIYFYTIRSGDFYQTRKMILLK